MSRALGLGATTAARGGDVPRAEPSSGRSVGPIAAALGDLRGLSRGLPPGDKAFDKAVATGGLVLRKGPRTAYWQKQRSDRDWQRHGRPWELLRRLADKARLGAPVGWRDQYDEGVTDSTVHNRWLRLKGMLPATLPGDRTRFRAGDLPVEVRRRADQPLPSAAGDPRGRGGRFSLDSAASAAGLSAVVAA